MAQPPEPNPLHNARGLTWSPLPTLCYKEGFSTESESTSLFRMAKEQLLDWEDFEANVRANSDVFLGEQTQLVPTQTERENVLVGNEHGLMGRFGQNVGHVMGEVNQACGLPIRYADYQAGTKNTEGYGHKNVPDLILTDGQNKIRGVGEGKTFWTKNLATAERPVLASWLGQLARYMDDLGIRHGFYTTYNVTVFVRRVSDTDFEVSPPILHSTKSTEGGGKDGVSVRECFLYLAVLANSDLFSYPKRYGKGLTNGSLNARERKSKRLNDTVGKLDLEEK